LPLFVKPWIAIGPPKSDTQFSGNKRGQWVLTTAHMENVFRSLTSFTSTPKCIKIQRDIVVSFITSSPRREKWCKVAKKVINRRRWCTQKPCQREIFASDLSWPHFL
jgi:hypothetical protein